MSTPDRSPPAWPYTGEPCPQCGRRKDGPRCWPCNRRDCGRCGRDTGLILFAFCWGCELEIDREQREGGRP